MTTIDLSLPEELKAFIETEAEHAGYPSAGKYVEAVLREMWKRSAITGLETQIKEGLDSGPSLEVTPEFWRGLKERLRQRHAAGAKP